MGARIWQCGNGSERYSDCEKEKNCWIVSQYIFMKEFVQLINGIDAVFELQIHIPNRFWFEDYIFKYFHFFYYHYSSLLCISHMKRD